MIETVINSLCRPDKTLDINWAGYTSARPSIKAKEAIALEK